MIAFSRLEFLLELHDADGILIRYRWSLSMSRRSALPLDRIGRRSR